MSESDPYNQSACTRSVFHHVPVHTCLCPPPPPQALYEIWCKVLDAVPERENQLDTELQRQQANETLRVEFAQIANEVGAYIGTRSSALAELSMQGKDTMEEQLEAVKNFQAETLAYQPKLDEAEAANQVTH